MFLTEEATNLIVFALCTRPGGAEESEIQDAINEVEDRVGALYELLCGAVHVLVH